MEPISPRRERYRINEQIKLEIKSFNRSEFEQTTDTDSFFRLWLKIPSKLSRCHYGFWHAIFDKPIYKYLQLKLTYRTKYSIDVKSDTSGRIFYWEFWDVSTTWNEMKYA